MIFGDTGIWYAANIVEETEHGSSAAHAGH